MLTARQNLLETVKWGNPDRFVNQYEGIRLGLNPTYFHSPSPGPGQLNVVNAWGVTNSWPEGSPGAFPVHNPNTIVIKDIEHWQDYVKAPDIRAIPDEEWEAVKKVYDAVDTNLAYKTPFVAPGIFEQCHHLGEIQATLMNLYEYEDEMHDLIRYITDYELVLAELICSKLHPDALFHHDDWGSRTSTFMSVGMFEDFYLEPYKEVYGYYKEHGVELIFHHSDSYGATLVPDMIEMGIDVWQGTCSTNDIPELLKKYEGKITYQGGFDGADYDTPDWNKEDIARRVIEFLDQIPSPKGFIPSVIQGGPGSVYPGVYEAIFDTIEEYNIKRFGVTKEECDLHLPLQFEAKGYA